MLGRTRLQISRRSGNGLAANLSTNVTARKKQPVYKGKVTPMREVPESIAYPDYALTGRPRPSPERIMVFTDPEIISKIRKSGRLARKMLDYANSLVEPGITTEDIDYMTMKEIIAHGAYPSPINYFGFPKAVCSSVNEVVCHGIPDDRKLVDGDMVSIDVSVFLDGYHGDNCGTVICGKSSDPSALNLISGTQEALDCAIAICRPGSRFADIGMEIEKVAARRDLRIIKEFCGHGTGPSLHMQPLVEHCANKSQQLMAAGMVFTIEPILVEGSRRIATWDDGWSAVTLDGGRGAQFEHEVLITENGVEILTVPENY